MKEFYRYGDDQVVKKHLFFPKNLVVNISQPHAQNCARKPSPWPRSDKILCNLHLHGVEKTAHSAREGARALMTISNLNSHNDLDDFWLLDHYFNLKSEETSFVWISCIFKKFQFWKFGFFLWKFEFFLLFDEMYVSICNEAIWKSFIDMATNK